MERKSVKIPLASTALLLIVEPMARPTVSAQQQRKAVTRSVSFDQEMFDFMEEDRRALRLDRSQYLRERLEERREAALGLATAQLRTTDEPGQTRNGLPLFPKKRGAGKATLKLVNDLRDASP